MNKKKAKDTWKKIWYFIWEDDSIWSWLVNIVLAFVIIKFLVYPGLSLLFATPYPVVAVVSGSMEHKTIPVCAEYDSLTQKCAQYDDINGEVCGKLIPKNHLDLDEYWDTCGDWYIARNITKKEFEKFRFKNGFNTGDIMVLIGKKPKDIKIGDVIVFTTTARPDPIIHRVVKVWEENGKYYYQTKGDHNNGTNPIVSEDKISQDRLLGKAVVRVPLLGWVKIGFVNTINFIIHIF